VSSWQLHVPHRSRADDLLEVAGNAVHLDGEAAQVAELALQARLELDMRSTGELLTTSRVPTPLAGVSCSIEHVRRPVCPRSPSSRLTSR